ncbi:MAG: hypothetical protein SXA11_08720 [Cyanobacteriota bacterium]|nr:hypothetical protein [Cyanobacteriota bacterium]
MTKLLEEAIAALSQLPESERDVIATLIIKEVGSEKSRSPALAKSEVESTEIGDDETVAKDTNQQIIEKPPGKSAAKPFWKKIQEIGAKVPREEWEKLPRDFSRNFESYMYGVQNEE